MRLNRVSQAATSAAVLAALPEADPDPDAALEPLAPMLGASSVGLRCGSMRLRGLVTEDRALGDVTADGLYGGHLPLNGDSELALPGLSEMDNDCSCRGLTVASLLVEPRVGVRGPPILDKRLLSYALDESLRFCRSKDRSPWSLAVAIEVSESSASLVRM